MKEVKFPELKHYPTKVKCYQGRGSDVTMVTVHETQGTTAAGGAATLTSRTDGSAHEVIGDAVKGAPLTGYRLDEDLAVLCHTGGQNGTGGRVNYGIEKAGISTWKKAFRLAFKEERDLIAFTAFRTAHVMLKWKIPNRYLSAAALDRAGDGFEDIKGWTYHRNHSLAFGTTNHTDPGIPNISWPHKRFETLVSYYYHNPTVRRVVSLREAKKALKRQRKERHE